jgi:hypothetical protein
MSKLRLDLDEIQVESFTTHSGPARGGTVAAHERVTWGCPPATQDFTCPASCNGSCGCPAPSANGTCDISCNGTCWEPTCESCMVTCNATGPQRCCAV